MKAVNVSKYRRVYGNAPEVARSYNHNLESGDPITDLTSESRVNWITAGLRSTSRALSHGGYGLFGRRKSDDATTLSQ
jgi:hypothetical protein